MDQETCRSLFSAQPVARLGTIGPDGPHLVPLVFAVHGDEIVSVIDYKPKRTARLRRLANIATRPEVTLLVDHYDDDWDRLWWVRADGVASIIESGSAHTGAVDLLAAKYRQYLLRRPEGPVITIAVNRWSGWSASSGG